MFCCLGVSLPLTDTTVKNLTGLLGGDPFALVRLGDPLTDGFVGDVNAGLGGHGGGDLPPALTGIAALPHPLVEVADDALDGAA